MFESKSRSIPAIAVIVGLAMLGVAHGAPTRTTHSAVELLYEQEFLPTAGGEITLGLYLAPDPGWHAYWINPGDAGKEPKVRWDLPEGFEAGEFDFPVPHVIPFEELNTYGYEEPLLLLSQVTVPAGLEAGNEYVLAGTASWVVCDDKLCVPERANVSVSMTVDEDDELSDYAQMFTDARAKVPQDVSWPATFELVDGNVVFRIRVMEPQETFESNQALKTDYLYVAEKRLVEYSSQDKSDGPVIGFSMPAHRLAERTESTDAILAFKGDDGATFAVKLTIDKGSVDAFMQEVPPTTGFASDSPGGVYGGGDAGGFSINNPQSFLAAIVAAFIGGLILNAMPCVFPVLSMKAMSLVNMSTADRSEARASGLMYTVGILVAFLLIAVVLLSIRATGEAVRWGFYLQLPIMNAIFGLVMVAIGLNMLGVFEFGTRLMGVGQSLTVGSERKAAFFTGLLAVVVATPCSLLFMAPALGWAFTQHAVVALATTMFLGLGLAFPYALLSFVPVVAKILPKPGGWMQNLRQVLAFPMFFTAVYLFWVVGNSTSASAMAFALIAATCIGFALWAYGKVAFSEKKIAWLSTATVGLAATAYALTGVLNFGDSSKVANDASASQLGALQIESFEPDRVLSYIADGKPAFVYFTADWCVSCKVNERVALATEKVGRFFNERGITVVEADWTLEDPEITEWLARYGRIGVPLYLYFPSGSTLDTPTILPQILFPDLVVDAISSADRDALRLAVVAEAMAWKAAGEQFVLPDVEPDWDPVAAFMEATTRWTELNDEIKALDDSDEDTERRLMDERGPYPKVLNAQAAATAIVTKTEDHPRRLDAAEFLVEHVRRAPGYLDAINLGATTILNDYPQYDNWPKLLRDIDFYTTPGTDSVIDQFFEDFPSSVEDSVAVASSKYYQASRYLRRATMPTTQDDEREPLKTMAREVATGLSTGL